MAAVLIRITLLHISPSGYKFFAQKTRKFWNQSGILLPVVKEDVLINVFKES